MKKLVTIVAITASVMATPAFAQSFNKDFGTGNELPFSYNSNGAEQTGKVAGRCFHKIFPHNIERVIHNERCSGCLRVEP